MKERWPLRPTGMVGVGFLAQGELRLKIPRMCFGTFRMKNSGFHLKLTDRLIIFIVKDLTEDNQVLKMSPTPVHLPRVHSTFFAAAIHLVFISTSIMHSGYIASVAVCRGRVILQVPKSRAKPIATCPLQDSSQEEHSIPYMEKNSLHFPRVHSTFFAAAVHLVFISTTTMHSGYIASVAVCHGRVILQVPKSRTKPIATCPLQDSSQEEHSIPYMEKNGMVQIMGSSAPPQRLQG